MKDFIDEMKEYFKNTPREKVLKDWEKSRKKFENIRPTVKEYNDYKMSKIPEIFDKDGKALDIDTIITPFWLWLVREAKVEVIDAENFIEVHGFTKDGDNLIPVISFAELLELYKNKKVKK